MTHPQEKAHTPGKQAESFTLVFSGDIRSFKMNPLTTETPWGIPYAASVGDALEELEEARAKAPGEAKAPGHTSGQLPAHVYGPWDSEAAFASRPTQHVKNASGYTLASFYSVDAARAALATFNSYWKHCGPRAAECAEADLLGEALAALRHFLEQPLDESDIGVDSCISEARAVLAKAQGGKP